MPTPMPPRDRIFDTAANKLRGAAAPECFCPPFLDKKWTKIVHFVQLVHYDGQNCGQNGQFWIGHFLGVSVDFSRGEKQPKRDLKMNSWMLHD